MALLQKIGNLIMLPSKYLASAKFNFRMHCNELSEKIIIIIIGIFMHLIFVHILFAFVPNHSLMRFYFS